MTGAVMTAPRRSSITAAINNDNIVTTAGPSKPKGKAIAPEAPSEQGLLAAEQEDHRGAQNPETPEVSGDDNASGDDNDTPMGDNELRRLREELRQEKTRREAVEEASKCRNHKPWSLERSLKDSHSSLEKPGRQP